MKAKDASVAGLTKGIEYLFGKYGVSYVKGTGTIVGEHEVKVEPINGGEPHTLHTQNIIIATGSEATPLRGLEIDEKRIVTSTGAIALTEVPKEMIVIGGGIIGLEMVRLEIYARIVLTNCNLRLGFCMVETWFRSYSCGVYRPDWWTWNGCGHF